MDNKLNIRTPKRRASTRVIVSPITKLKPPIIFVF